MHPILSTQAFAKWGIDFVGPIKPPAKHTHAQYIIVAIDYLTKWVEAKATVQNNARITAKFLYEFVFTRYGLPIEIVSDQGVHFINEVVEFLLSTSSWWYTALLLLIIHRPIAKQRAQIILYAQLSRK